MPIIVYLLSHMLLLFFFFFFRFYSDSGVNFAMQTGVKLSRSEVMYFKHNDMADLERLLKGVQDKDKYKHMHLALLKRVSISSSRLLVFMLGVCDVHLSPRFSFSHCFCLLLLLLLLSGVLVVL